jgi:hypothetical protein
MAVNKPIRNAHLIFIIPLLCICLFSYPIADSPNLGRVHQPQASRNPALELENPVNTNMKMSA